jgi:DNA repair exonuclease SbcCD ATPase subunit
MLQSERDKADALAKEIASLRDALAEASAAAKSNIDLEQQLAEMRNQREQDKMVWDAERSALVSSLHTATGAKASAEADRDFFREQYAQASGYVSSVRVENQQLEMRAAIAEKQATDGVGMIRNTFQERLRNLEGEIRKYKNLAALLTEKDKRTGDELRRRAGEEPELRLRCGKLEDKTQRLIAEKAVLESRLEDAEGEHRALEQKLRGWREEIVKVDAEMRTYKAKMEALVVVAGAEGEDDFSYRCEWRVGKNISCESIFDDNLVRRNCSGYVFG